MRAIHKRTHVDVARVLSAIRNAPHGLTIKELFEDDSIRFTQPTITNIVGELISVGLVYRVPQNERRVNEWRGAKTPIYKATRQADVLSDIFEV